MGELLGDRQLQRDPPVREQIASLLRDAIVEMRLEPGQILVERELCEMTGASRPSVREAIRQLEAEGLVASHNGMGIVVARTTPELAEQVYEVRAELEGLAAELFARRASDELVAELVAAVDEVTVAARERNPTAAVDVLHARNRAYDILFRGAGNPVLAQTVGILQRRVNQLRAFTLDQPGRSAQNAREIRAILDAIQKRDPAGARAAATFHVQETARTVRDAVGRPHTAPTAERPAST